MPEPTIREQVETTIRETLAQGGDLMAALSPLLERVERELKEMTMLHKPWCDTFRAVDGRDAPPNQCNCLHIKGDDVESVNKTLLNHAFESELRRRVEGISDKDLQRLDRTGSDCTCNICGPHRREWISRRLLLMLAPPATPKTEKESSHA